eukprot:TRINITY_DN8058_c0_g1_i1.p1 TRINITY_DN8058_c0_g1~~TRINITY_DN8058_c0_g1_i1.p1  ORF type:complete len:494 (-),score=154.22 TRINITY_DN8058_c0_g1_i1:1018-2499(-)
MGRKKIAISRLKDDRNRHVTFHKRKAGLIKKAMELSILCSCDVGLFIFAEPQIGTVHEYCSVNPEVILHKYIARAHEEHECFENADYSTVETRLSRGKGSSDKGEDDVMDRKDESLKDSEKSRRLVGPMKTRQLSLSLVNFRKGAGASVSSPFVQPPHVPISPSGRPVGVGRSAFQASPTMMNVPGLFPQPPYDQGMMGDIYRTGYQMVPFSIPGPGMGDMMQGRMKPMLPSEGGGSSVGVRGADSRPSSNTARGPAASGYASGLEPKKKKKKLIGLDVNRKEIAHVTPLNPPVMTIGRDGMRSGRIGMRRSRQEVESDGLGDEEEEEDDIHTGGDGGIRRDDDVGGRDGEGEDGDEEGEGEEGDDGEEGEGEDMGQSDDGDDDGGEISAIPGYGDDDGVPIVHSHISGDRGIMSGMALPTVTTPLTANPEARDRSLYPFSPSIMGYSTKPSPTTPFSSLFGEEEWGSSGAGLAPSSGDRSKPPLSIKKESPR